MSMRRHGLLLGFLTLLWAFMVQSDPVLLAQAVYGSITGTVTDETGGAIPGAEVTITDVNKGTNFSVITNQSGNYTKQRLIPGVYRVRVEMPGFKTFVSEEVVLRADTAVQVNAVMSVGEITEEVVVTSQAPLLQTEKSDTSTILEEKQIVELPVLDRNFTQLQLLTPGTTKQTWQHASSENPQGSIQIQVNGQSFFGTSFQLDGTDNRDPILGIIVINPPLDAVSEFKITTSNYDAEFGLAAAGVVTAQTKSGTNELHGTLWEYHRNNATNARDPFSQGLDPAGPRTPPLKWNKFGATAGGALAKDKSFLFGYYEGTRRRNGGSRLISVPTAAARNGNLAAYGRSIFDPLTGNPDGSGRTQFPGNAIPPNRLSPQAQNLLKFIPLPNTGPAGAIENNYAASGVEKFDDDQFGFRWDHYVSEKTHLFGRYSFADFAKISPTAFGELAGGPAMDFIFFGGLSDTRNQSIAAGFDYTLNPNLLTDFRFGYFRYRVRVRPGAADTTPATEAGIPGLNRDQFSGGMPAFFVSGIGGFNMGYALGVNQCNCPLDETENQWQFVNNWTRIQGNHTFKFGVDYRRADNLRVPSDWHRAGELSFSTERTGARGVSGSGLGLATFLLGDVTFFRRYASSVTDAGEIQHRFFTYAQDTWRVSPKLTLNYGLRWELILPESVTCDGCGGNVDLNTGEVLTYGVGNTPRDGGIDASLDNFAVRAGLAYQFSDRTVLRMGYGRSYDIGTFGSVFGHTVTQNLPVLARQELTVGGNPFSSVFNLAEGPVAPPFPEVGSRGRFPLPPGVSMFYIEPRLKLPYADNWNVTIQHQVTPDLAVDAAYVGNVGRHTVAYLNFNQPMVGPGDVKDRTPFFPRFGWLQSIQSRQCNCLSTNYHSLQTKLTKRFSEDYSILAHFTWQKALNFGEVGTYYIYNHRLNYGPSDFDRTTVFVLNHLWELPWGPGKRWLVDGPVANLLGGWSLNGVITLQSGLPFTPGLASNAPLNTPIGLRPNVLGDPKLDNGTRNRWFNGGPGTVCDQGKTGCIWQIPDNLKFGTASRGMLRGPGLATYDISVFKNFRIPWFTPEDARLQFRAEVFNAFNRTNLGLPNSTVDSPSAGVISGLASPMRQIQWALRIEY